MYAVSRRPDATESERPSAGPMISGTPRQQPGQQDTPVRRRSLSGPIARAAAAAERQPEPLRPLRPPAATEQGTTASAARLRLPASAVQQKGAPRGPGLTGPRGTRPRACPRPQPRPPPATSCGSGAKLVQSWAASGRRLPPLEGARSPRSWHASRLRSASRCQGLRGYDRQPSRLHHPRPRALAVHPASQGFGYQPTDTYRDHS